MKPKNENLDATIIISSSEKIEKPKESKVAKVKKPTTPKAPVKAKKPIAPKALITAKKATTPKALVKVKKPATSAKTKAKKTTTPKAPIKAKNSTKAKENWIEIFKYTLCAGSAGGIEAVSMMFVVWILSLAAPVATQQFDFLGQPMDWILLVGQMISLSLSIVWNFTLNRKFTFKSSANVPKVLLLAFAFYIPFFPLSSLFVGWFAPYLTVSAGVAVGLAGAIAKGIAMIMNFVFEFIWQKFFVFRKKA